MVRQQLYLRLEHAPSTCVYDRNMSKPISISFGKSKLSLPSKTSTTAASSKSIPLNKPSSLTKSALRAEFDDEDEAPPIHESVTGFASDGAILSAPLQTKEQLIIKNAGNGDWRKRGRGRNILPKEPQTQKAVKLDSGAAIVEKDEVSKASGLQFAEPGTTSTANEGHQNGVAEPDAHVEPVKERTEDEVALQALLNAGSDERISNAVILQAENSLTGPIDEAEDFRADIASRPDSCTLDEYAAMPVEEFGMALLRGMGARRKAKGEVIDYGQTNGSSAAAPKVREPRQGYLGIGAKAAPGTEAELGAWGKADMRKGMKKGTGEGLYTPVLLRDKRTGEMLTEEELETRKQEAKERIKENGQEDWRGRRDRNLERSGRDAEQKRLTDKDDYRDQMNGFSKTNHSSGRKRGWS